MNPKTTLALAAVMLSAAACFSPAEPVPVRWFTLPTPPAVTVTAVVPEPAGLRIGNVDAPPHLGTGFVWRRSDVEIAIDDVNRWTDEPSAMVTRALERALFDTGRFRQSDRDARLDVRIDAFEAVLGDTPHARVAAELRLVTAAGETLLRRRIDQERPLAGTAAEDFVRALADALAAFAEQAADWRADD